MQGVSAAVDEVKEGSCGQSVMSFKAGYEALDKETRELMSCFLSEHVGLVTPRCERIRTLSTLKRVVGDVLEKYRYAYNGMYCMYCMYVCMIHTGSSGSLTVCSTLNLSKV